MINNEPKLTRILAMRVSLEDHKRLRIEAAKRDMTMKQLVFAALVKFLEKN